MVSAILAMMIKLFALVALLFGCAEPRPELGDVGPFLPEDVAVVEDGTTGFDVGGTGETWCFTAPEESEEDLSIVGQLFEMSWSNMYPGEYTGDVRIRIMDMCGTEVHSFDVLPTGSYALHLPVGTAGFNGYFEFPYCPGSGDPGSFKFNDYPLFREFDKPFAGKYIHSNVRIFIPDIITFATAIVEQKDDAGYVQGTVYRWLDYETVQGAAIVPSSGKVWYISNAQIPDAALSETQNKGMFVVANAAPGPFEIQVTLPSGKSFTKRIHTWAYKSQPNGVVTNTGVPVPPEYL